MPGFQHFALYLAFLTCIYDGEYSHHALLSMNLPINLTTGLSR